MVVYINVDLHFLSSVADSIFYNEMEIRRKLCVINNNINWRDVHRKNAVNNVHVDMSSLRAP